MKLNFNSFYKEWANKTIDWVTSDTKELYEKNLKERYDDLKNNHWIDNHFTYTFNSLGFRSVEFSDDPGIMFLGCSLTMGIGLPEQILWTTIVAKNLNLKCYNLGIGGSSSDTAFRLCYGYIDKIKPKMVIFKRPPGIRLEHITSYKIRNLMSTNKNDTDLIKWFAYPDDMNSELNFLKNNLAIENLCIQRKIKFVQTDNKRYVPIDLARDLMHPGIKSNSLFADYILSQI